MDAILLKAGTPFYSDDYTARPGDVKYGKMFIGNGSDELQLGLMPIVKPKDKLLMVNESYNIEAGYHDGTDIVHQDVVEADGMTVIPRAAGQVVEVIEKYMKGNVTVLAVENFRPELIKKGITIGEGDTAILGTFEGFV